MSETDAADVSLEEMDKQTHLHPFTSLADHLKTGPKVMLEGQGVMVRDNHGNEYIDSMAGWHGFTYSAHPLAAAAALANLDIIEREQLPARAQKVGSYFQQQLRAKIGPHPLVGEVRGVALIAAVELVKDRTTKQPFPLDLKIAPRMAKLCVDEGLITRALPQINALSFSPPLVITEAECDEVVARFGRALDQLADELVREGSWPF
jgi:adenosylmethionine-8-amino-7-oxononanoate aminotransferase